MGRDIHLVTYGLVIDGSYISNWGDISYRVLYTTRPINV